MPAASLKAVGAKRVPAPDWVDPQLAMLSADVPEGEGWIHEIKFDGYRILAFARGGKVSLKTRNKLDWTEKFLPIADSVAELPARELILDGELCVMDAKGNSSFRALQEALTAKSSAGMCYIAFDILYCDGWDLREVPLVQRKELLRSLCERSQDGVVCSDHVAGEGPKLFAAAKKAKAEGIISKRADEPYRSGRTPSWRKSKCRAEDEFLIVGFTPHSASAGQIGALVLGEREAKSRVIRYCGKVGTGFSDEMRRKLFRMLKQSEQRGAPVEGNAAPVRHVRWVKPVNIAQIHYTERTADGLLRHPVFLGLRKDLEPEEVVRAKPKKLGKR